MGIESDPANSRPGPPADQRRPDGGDLIGAALDFLGRISEAGKCSSGSPNLADQENRLREWAESRGLLLDRAEIVAKLNPGGQEHDFYQEGERVFKVTRNGVFGLSPGIELALVSTSQDARRFHLWEASPIEYLERLRLQNILVPGLNSLEGVIVQSQYEIAIVTSQPRFDIVPVTTAEIDAWFASLGFVKIASAAYYRAADNLGIFDAHDKNLVRAGPDVLVPFDVIPCHPAGGFLDFITDTLAAGYTLRAVRTVNTSAY